MAKNSSASTTVDFSSCIKHFLDFVKDVNMQEDIINRIHIVVADATYNMQKYRSKFSVNMEKEELLRDVIFFGSSLISQVKNKSDSTMFYKSLVKASASIVEIGIEKRFDPKFISKILKAKSSFECREGTYFQAESFYFLFKTHFRISHNLEP